MADLSDLQLQVAYRSDGDASIIRDFYIPCLQRAVLYQRAVGYFTSSSLSLAAQGVAHLLKNNGRLQLIASPILSPDDIDAIQRGYRRREVVLRSAVTETFQEIESQLIRDRLNCLAWLIEHGRLDVRLAIPVNKDGSLRRGIYHEKIGIFVDSLGNAIAFSGSANETAGGLIDNFESIDVFWSWEDAQRRVQKKRNDFDRLWSNSTPHLEVIPFTAVAKEMLSRYRRDAMPKSDPLEESNSASDSKSPFGLPDVICLRDYQHMAINNWLANRGRGTLKMATGSGKTITALAAAARLVTHDRLGALVIVCPYRHLVTQWARECVRFGADPILAFESRARWADDLSQRIFAANRSDAPSLLVVITTTSTFASEAFQLRIRYLPQKSMLIGDEVHNMGASQLRDKLPENIPLRLALSATPERWFDDRGTAAIFDYFGSVLEPEFTLADALRQGALVPYRYYPILVPLTDDEMVTYLELSERIAKAMFAEDDDETNTVLTALLAKRARVLGVASNKLPALRELMSKRMHTSHTLIYCGDGSVDSDALDGEMERHVDAVARLLGSDLGFRVATYTAETPLDEREDLRARLDNGELQGLVAIRCLDEGVDIPSISSAVILASNKNPRQFIQRRGRILRPHPRKPAAEIFDMIVLPPVQSLDAKLERNLFRGELLRFVEFADLALNAGEARATVLELQRRYHLMDI